MESNFKYAAFISYRHIEPDKLVAKKLHTYIETYGIPAAVKATSGKKSMGRVFRDEEELPLTPNLGDDITQALADSEWLIVICSPQLLVSKWCMKEIDTFIHMGKRDKILTVLVSGTPEESFPPQLRFADVDGHPVEVEPLAANVVAPTLAGTLKKLKNEKLRILAPMLGVSYDELRQRARERRLKAIISMSAAALCLISAFALYALRQNRIITDERNNALINQSKYLADFSGRSLRDGDRMLAMLLSLEALPEDPANPDRPLTDEAVTALRNAALSESGGNRYSPVATIKQEDIKSYRADHEDLMLFSQKADNYIVRYDLSTGENLSEKLDDARVKIEREPVSVWFNHKLTPTLFYNEHAEYYLDAVPEVIGLPAASAGKKWTGVEADGISKAYYTELGYNLYLQNMYFWGATISLEGVGSMGDVKPLWRSDDTFLVGGGNPEYRMCVRAIHCATLPDLNGKTLHEYLPVINGEPQTSSNYEFVESLGCSMDNTVVFAQSNYSIYLWNYDTEELVLRLESARFDAERFEVAAASPTERRFAVVTSGGTVFVVDFITGETLTALNMGLARATSVQWNVDGTKLLCACEDDRARIYSAYTGELLQTLDASGALEDATYAQVRCEGAAEADDRILLVGEDFIDVFSLSAAVKHEDDTTASPFVWLDSTGEARATAFSGDGKTAWILTEGSLIVYDTESGKRLDAFPEDHVKISAYGDFIVAYGYRYSRKKQAKLNVYNTHTPSLAATLKPSYEHVYTDSNGKEARQDDALNVRNIRFSPDGRTMILGGGYFSDNEADACVFAYDTENWTELWHFGVRNPIDESERVFAFASDWKGKIAMESFFVNDGKDVATLYRIGFSAFAVQLRDARTGEIKSEYPINEKLHYTASVNGDYVFGSDDNSMVLRKYDISTGKELAQLQLPTQLRQLIYPVQKDVALVMTSDENDSLFFGKSYYWNTVTGELTDVPDSEAQALRVANTEKSKLNTAPDGSVLEMVDGAPRIIKPLTVAELMAYARDALQSRELTTAEREQFYITK